MARHICPELAAVGLKVVGQVHDTGNLTGALAVPFLVELGWARRSMPEVNVSGVA